MAQIRALHTATLAAVASATPVPPGSVSADRQQLTLLIQSGQAAVAVETVYYIHFNVYYFVSSGT